MSTTTGRRRDVRPHEMDPGDYGRDPETGDWYARTPAAGELYLCGYLRNHEVVEHDDGTITVSPSILVSHPHRDGVRRWHGFLERGVWRRLPDSTC